MSHQSNRFGKQIHWFWDLLCLAVKKFFRIDGAQWAGAFAFNAFFSLFPLIVLFVTIASAFIDRERAGWCSCIFILGACLCAAQADERSASMRNYNDAQKK